MTFKNHACCGHTFAAIDGALAVRSKLGVAARDIERVKVGTYRAGLEVAHYEDPRTPAEGRFSLKYVVASALAHGSVRLAAFEPARLADPVTRELMRRVDVAIDPELDGTFPGQRAARVSIAARDGRRAEHYQPTRKGDPDAPLLRPGARGEASRARRTGDRASPKRARCSRGSGVWSGKRRSSELSPQALFAPRAVALVGASGDATKNTARPLRFLRKHGYGGRIVAINAIRSQVLGERAYTSIADAPGTIDHAFIMTPGDTVEAGARGLRARGIPVATIFTDGFAESARRARSGRRASSRAHGSSACGCSARTAWA